MSSPAPYASEMDTSQGPGNPFVDIPTRPMRVKVLYTFDNDNKTNCLARFPDVLSVPTIPIDDTTQIGVIELRTCIRAIVGASPELVSRLNQGDFTIYAYDYSEYETPLVGQGMLSSVLAANSPTPAAPAHQSKTMITGRVCKNIVGLFSNGVKETLEVKLRLVPVPKPIQQEYVKSMEMYRSMNHGMSGGFDPNAWSESMQGGSALGAPFEHVASPGFPGQDAADQDFSMSANPFQPQRHMSNASFHGRPSSSGHAARTSASLSRVGSPMLTGQNDRSLNTRPSSRASVRSERPTRRREESFSQGVDQLNEDGPARKRAKIMQTDWRGKSSFGANADSLRVTASTAASIRMHNPVPTRPGLPSNNSLELPPRMPTPVPQRFGPAQSKPRPQPSSLLRSESTFSNAQQYQSYDQLPSAYAESDAIMSSPEEGQFDHTAEGTPMEFPSSPPAMPNAPSSPGLPTLPRPADSGYMSGSAFDCLDDDENRSVDDDDMQVAAQYQPRQPMLLSDLSFVEQTPGPPELLPTRSLQTFKQPNRKHSQSQSQSSRPQPHPQITAPQTSRRSSLALPPKLAQAPTVSIEIPDAVMQPVVGVQNDAFQKPFLARASSNNTVMSEANSPAFSDDLAFGGKPRSGSGAKRKKAIQDKLVQSVAAGGLPVFCCNCGAIETPTWRSIHVKTVDGCPDDDDKRDTEGVTMGIEIVERDSETQKVTRYRIIKSMRKSKDRVQMQGYQTMSVCNPCGLWFNKFKYMRPAEKWNKNPKAPKRKQSKKDNLQSDMAEPQTDFYNDIQSGIWTDQVQPEDSMEEQSKKDEEVPSDTQPPTRRPRASSMQAQDRPSNNRGQWTGAELDAALHRAIQSSPARFQGTQESPIELEDDLTPHPTRRLLFPSPRKEGEMKSLDDSNLPLTKKTPSSGSLLVGLATTSEELFNPGGSAMDKENCPPMDPDDDFTHLFEGSPNALFFKTPSKRTPSKSTPPSKSIAQFDALLATPTPSRQSLITRTPTRNIDAFLPTFSSSETKNLFPCTPSRYAFLLSPSRQVSGSGSNPEGQLTPFTRHLTQLLSEANGPGGNNMGSDGGLLPFSSPGRPFDFGDLPTFMTPGRNHNMDRDLGLHLNFDNLEGFGDVMAGMGGVGTGAVENGQVEVKIEGMDEGTGGGAAVSG